MLLCTNLAVVHALTHTSLPPALLCVSRGCDAAASSRVQCSCLHAQIVSIGFGKADMPDAGWDAMKEFVDGLGVSELSEVLSAITCRVATQLMLCQAHSYVCSKRHLDTEHSCCPAHVTQHDAACWVFDTP